MASNITKEDDWQCNKSILQRNKFMLEEQLATDVTFIFGNSETSGKHGRNKDTSIGAHKYMLISSSPVFWAMFNGNLKEGNTVTVDDVEYDAFVHMLRFIYYEHVKLSGSLVMQILNAAKKYMIPSLARKCTEFLEKNLNAASVCEILEQALFFDEKELGEKCMEIIQTETQDVFHSDGFFKLARSTLMKILSIDELAISEIDVFQAAVGWAVAQSGEAKGTKISGDTIRNHLGQALYNIRFPVMPADEFADIVSPSGILSKDEELQCFRYITSKSKPSGIEFPATEREHKIGSLVSYLPLPLLEKRILNQSQIQIGYNIMSLNKEVTLTGVRVLCRKNVQVGVYSHSGGYGMVANAALHKPPRVITKDDHSYTDIKFVSPIKVTDRSWLNMQVNYSCIEEQNINAPVMVYPANRQQKLTIFTFNAGSHILEKGQIKFQIQAQSPLGQTLLGVFVRQQ